MNLTYKTFEKEVNELGFIVKHEGDNCFVLTKSDREILSISKEYTHGVDTMLGIIESLYKNEADKLLDLSFSLSKVPTKDRE